MRLTSELIQKSLSYVNPLSERELDIRGHKIPAIENLGAAAPHECIDFTDNDIRVLGSFPWSPRLRTLLCARNRIKTIDPSVPQSIPGLTTLVLCQNRLDNLKDLYILSRFSKLVHLVLIENPVTREPEYRSWVVWLCPSVRFLDFQKVRQVERENAASLFGTLDNPSDRVSKILVD